MIVVLEFMAPTSIISEFNYVVDWGRVPGKFLMVQRMLDWPGPALKGIRVRISYEGKATCKIMHAWQHVMERDARGTSERP